MKLSKTSINFDRWEIEKIEDDVLCNSNIQKLHDKKTGDNYTFTYIIGINEIADNEFLIYRNFPKGISRIKLENSRKKVIFSYDSQECILLNDDKILFTHFDKLNQTIGDDIYSISENKLLDDFYWLKGKNIVVYTENNQSIIYVEDIPSYNNNEYFLSFAVSSNTLKPISDCYSYLRDKYIKINSKEEYLELLSEERKYISIMENIKLQNKNISKNKVKEKILNHTRLS